MNGSGAGKSTVNLSLPKLVNTTSSYFPIDKDTKFSPSFLNLSCGNLSHKTKIYGLIFRLVKALQQKKTAYDSISTGVMDPDNFDFTLDRELEDDVVDVEEVELGGNSNPLVSTNANVIDIQDDTVAEVGQNRLKRKVPPQVRKLKKEPGKRYRSPAWDHFNDIKEGGETKWAECKYCQKRYAAESKKHGVSNLKAHIPVCPLYPNRDQHGQQNLSFRPTDGGGVNVVTHVFSFDDCKRALAEMVIIDELPFRFVEGIGFRKFCKVMQPKFSPVSRQTITREVGAIHKNERAKLKKFLKGRRICLTTDTWTSIQNLNYMCLTAHFIDDDWKLQKRILNFCQIEDHKGVTIGKKIESLLLEWNIDGIFTLTVDNASSNATAIEYLKRKTMDWKRTILEHEYIHMRCCAHILNLIVVEGLKDTSESILRVRDVVRYVRSSPQRMETFNKCVEKEKIKSKQTVCLDVCTRWNSTYLMLEVAIKFEKAFQRMGEEDSSFIKFFGIKEGEDDLSLELEGGQSGSHRISVPTPRQPTVPNKLDWKKCGLFVTFLKLFYDATKKFSASLFVTSNVFFHELYEVQTRIDELIANRDPFMSSMAIEMKRKFERYWGDGEKFNPLLYVAVAMDPRFKLRLVKFCYTKSKGKAEGEKMEKQVKDVLNRLYDSYAKEGEGRQNVPSASPMPRVMEENEDCDHRLNLALEFDTYLEEEYSSGQSGF
ncbi:zinc finger BED domain-containing protein RICESLEEPER 2-like [Rhododendron vialii]|uniref:zinc finger BED domain-containing protein RICESLEEPER 2-like n=1 Tax=Rhododendron vialii TaxID=182163 RepID=UPI00265F722F|nr:zinc finger BED domain-containing protein RICESLEEPER 2-like [Rhododendron vialii]